MQVLFDFENAGPGHMLPITLSSAGVTAVFSSSGAGGFYTSTPSNALIPTPTGFSGLALVPSSVYLADLYINFDKTMGDFSILFAPQDLACDTTARMRATAYQNGAIVGTPTAYAPIPGTWPSGTIAISVVAVLTESSFTTTQCHRGATTA
jgi:hypothetical protein